MPNCTETGVELPKNVPLLASMQFNKNMKIVRNEYVFTRLLRA